jgi:hypothetical protein
VQNVLQQERADLDEEQLCLLEYFSLLKGVTASEKVKVEVRQKFADVMAILLDRQHGAIKELNAQSQQMLADAKDMYADAEARTNTTIKQEEGLNARLLIVCKQERVVVEREQDL